MEGQIRLIILIGSLLIYIFKENNQPNFVEHNFELFGLNSLFKKKSFQKELFIEYLYLTI